MATTAARQAAVSTGSRGKIVLFAGFVLLTIFVVAAKNGRILDPTSPIAQHFAPAKMYLIPHAIFATIALILGIFQFSNRLRARYLKVHRAFGYIYTVCAIVGAPTGVLVAMTIGPPELLMASVTQSFGWLSTLAIALYCIKTGNIAEHRRWMIRSYPFAAVFSIARLFVPLGMKIWGPSPGQVQVVWTTIAMAAFLPSVFLEWPKIVAKRSSKSSMAIAGD